MIAVIDYGIGNVQSVVNACARHGVPARRVTDGADLDGYAASHIILPGVGAIGAALRRLRERGLETVLIEQVLRRRTPFLGICVGMQMLAEVCEEFGSHEGLGWIEGRVTRLAPGHQRLRIPHVGWNTIRTTPAAGPILAGLDGEDFYFVHSYRMLCDSARVAAWTSYGEDVTAAVRRDNIVGVQFHPEKSAAAGFRLIGQFIGAVHA